MIKAKLDDSGQWIRPDGQPMRDGEAVELDAWRGTGRADPKAAYAADVPGCILGEPADEYFAATKEHASRYGPDVQQHTLQFKNPVILDSREKLGNLTGILPCGVDEIAKVYGELRSKLVAQGHDGLIVVLPDTGDCSLSGEGVKLIREHFSVTQAVRFAQQSRDADSLPVSESAKGWPAPADEGVSSLEGLLPKERE